jgi:hypothetical protein
MLKAQVFVNHKTFNLMELCQVCVVQSFVSEDSVDGEKFTRPERFLFRYLLEVS